MNSFCRKFITEWRSLKLSFDEGAFVAAVSGGADSVALLLALEELRGRKKISCPIIVAHFDHSLRGAESKADAEMVKELSAKLDFEFRLGEGIIEKKGNLEQNARNARYSFLIEVAEKYKAAGVLTAHTENDQAETFLMNMIRGSGHLGLSGIKPIRELAEGKGILLIRPLLRWAKRKDTEEYCALRGIEFRNDSMNEDPRFSRVRVRKQLIPLLETFNPKIVETLASMAGILGENARIQSEEAYEIPDFLSLRELQALEAPKLYAKLRKWLKAQRGSLSRINLKHIEALERLINSRKSGRMAELPDGGKVFRKDGKLFFQKKG